MEILDKYRIINEELNMENEILRNNLKTIKEGEDTDKNKIEYLSKENKELREHLDEILYSRSYKFIQKFKKIVRR